MSAALSAARCIAAFGVLLLAVEVSAEPPAHPAAMALMARFECHRCHEGTGLAPPPMEKRCVGCHQTLLAGRPLPGGPIAPETLARWQGNLRSLNAAPSLTGSARLRRAWLARFLHTPVDLRPGLPASMPRLTLTTAEAGVLAAHLSPDEPAAEPVFGPGAVMRGRALYLAAGCDACHAFTGAVPRRDGTYARTLGQPHSVVPMADAVALAPDLAVTRARFRPERLADWLHDPPAMKPDTLMPRLGLSSAQAVAVAAFVLNAPLASVPATPAGDRLPLLQRPVPFAEVRDRVFRAVCWHCHSDAVLTHGDGGPGNTGGLGFAGRGLDLSTYISMAKGSRGPDGRRRSIFRPAREAPNMPRIIAHLVARHHEVAGRELPGIRGMPLGLPPVPWEDIQRLDSWIAQGRPR